MVQNELFTLSDGCFLLSCLCCQRSLDTLICWLESELTSEVLCPEKSHINLASINQSTCFPPTIKYKEEIFPFLFLLSDMFFFFFWFSNPTLDFFLNLAVSHFQCQWKRSVSKGKWKPYRKFVFFSAVRNFEVHRHDWSTSSVEGTLSNTSGWALRPESL